MPDAHGLHPSCADPSYLGDTAVVPDAHDEERVGPGPTRGLAVGRSVWAGEEPEVLEAERIVSQAVGPDGNGELAGEWGEAAAAAAVAVAGGNGGDDGVVAPDEGQLFGIFCLGPRRRQGLARALAGQDLGDGRDRGATQLAIGYASEK